MAPPSHTGHPNPPRPRHALIVGVNYWPEETGIAPYTTGLAEHLATRGDRVSVITGMPHYPQWRVHDDYRGRARRDECIRGVEVHRYSHYVPARQSALRRATFEASFAGHASPLAGVARPDVVIGVVPNLGAGVLAALAARRHGVPYGLIFQDLVGRAARQSGVAGGRKVAGFAAAVEGWVARRATAVAVVADGFRPYLVERGVPAERIERVRNWVHVGAATMPRGRMRARLGLPADAWVCLHAGNMGYKQGLENLIESARLAATTDPSLLFVLMGDGNQRAHLQALAAGLRLPNLRFLDPQPEECFPDALAAADVLLVNQRGSVIDMSLPGKLTSYFAAARPVVAAVAQLSETAAEVRAAGAGIVVDAESPDQLLAALRRLAADRALAVEFGRRGQTFAATHLTAGAALSRLERFVWTAASGGQTVPSLTPIEAPWAGDPGGDSDVGGLTTQRRVS